MLPQQPNAQRLSLPFEADLSSYQAAASFVRLFPIGYAREHQIIAFQDGEQGPVRMALAGDAEWSQIDIVTRRLRCVVHPFFSDADQIRRAINTAYSVRDGAAEQFLESIENDSEPRTIARIVLREDLLDHDGRAPIIRLVNQLIFDAVVAGASDIHFQPCEDSVIVRQRIDGVLFDCFEVPKAIQEEVLTRIKVLGNMNIAEKRLPQDGRATVQLGDRLVDLRIASLPTSHNERIVIRLLDKSARLYTLEELGMPAATLRQWRALIRADHGLILVTGPTGSGKSTTLYGTLQALNSKESNILTLEDPIEYQLDGISQTQINEKKGMSFASGMRNLLRQDPDIIMVGEIRDRETASMAIQASLTGHLVFSTLHTNDAASALTRLLDLGVEPYLVASSLIGTLAQRLVRTLCPNCKNVAADGTATPFGCDRCRQSGFRGRVGLFELLVMNDRIRSLVQLRENASVIRQAAMECGLTLLADDGKAKISQGRTTLDEVLRVTSMQLMVD